MGSGKSTVAKNLAKQLSFSFVDTDNEIETLFAMKITEIFKEFGENEFRKKENEILLKLLQYENQVIATGGGLPCFYNNMELINESGLSIYLKAEPAFLTSRLKIKKKNRPLITDLDEDDLTKYLNNLLQKRETFYNQAQIVVEAKSIKVKELAKMIKNA